ncbi:nuclear transport factor 2 family protein [Phenylobacterium sp.]|uniref:nuclear transport factor 2 family protein n=1 Tax=Phenylobacterium sp. TaxID=1871053 RepID=UPI00286D2662|nr:nuclear transport factor 2 family protein [Phenylobacterium sp.]
MSLMQQFVAQRRAFEAAYEDGDWRPLEAFFHPDVTYEVMNMPFHCVVQGRSAMLAAIRRSVEGFDHLCDRTVGIDVVVREEGANVITYGGMRFERPGAPPTTARLWEIATYRDGLIQRLVDLYDAGVCAEFERWMAAWGEGLDPSYVSS